MSSQIDIEEALQENFLFESLDAAEVTTLAQALQLRSFDEGDAIVREGEEADALFLVISGSVNVMKSNGQFLAMLGAKGFFGEMGLFIEGARRTADCVAAADTTCAIIRKEALDRFCDANSPIGLKIYRAIVCALSERLQATSADLAMLMGTRIRSQQEVSGIVEKAKGKS